MDEIYRIERLGFFRGTNSPGSYNDMDFLCFCKIGIFVNNYSVINTWYWKELEMREQVR